MVVALLLAAGATAGTLVTSAAVGYEAGVDEIWAGLDVALWSSHDSGVAPIGRVNGGVGIAGGPLANVELGFMARMPEDEAILRWGFLVRGTLDGGPRRYPIDLTTGDATRIGVVPAVLTQVELEWPGPSPHAVGFQAGMGSAPTTFRCTPTASLVDCLNYTAGFHGSFFARKHFADGFAAQVSAGPTVLLTLGRAW